MTLFRESVITVIVGVSHWQEAFSSRELLKLFPVSPSPFLQPPAHKCNVLAQAVELAGEGSGDFHAIDGLLDFIEAGDNLCAFLLVHRSPQIVFEQQ